MIVDGQHRQRRPFGLGQLILICCSSRRQCGRTSDLLLYPVTNRMDSVDLLCRYLEI
jgi:hypothetical protein